MVENAQHDGTSDDHLLPAWLIAFIVLVWLQAFLWPGATLSHMVLDVLGNILFFAGLALMGWAICTFRRNATFVVPHQIPDRITITGPFARSRNPIYRGDLMVLAGVVAGLGAWPSLVLIPLLAMILERCFVAHEEARMEQYFKAKFTDYTVKTPRWL